MYGFTNSRTAAFQQSPSKAALPLSAKSGHWLAARNRTFVVVRRSAGTVLSAFSPAERAGASGPRDQAGTYVNLITFSPIGSLATRRSGDGGLAKNGLPRPSTTGWRYSRYSSIRPSAVRLRARSGPPTSISPANSALSNHRLDLAVYKRGVGAD
jgi:hypothetical protein